MKRIWLASAALLVLTGCTTAPKPPTPQGAPQATPNPAGLQVGMTAPAFTLDAVGGKKVSLQDYHQPVLLFFSMGPG